MLTNSSLNVNRFSVNKLIVDNYSEEMTFKSAGIEISKNKDENLVLFGI